MRLGIPEARQRFKLSMSEGNPLNNCVLPLSWTHLFPPLSTPDGSTDRPFAE